MAPIYKLIYFNTTGRAECARFLLKYGNIDFEDVRISRDEWPKLKDQTPFGQIPILEVNGEKINQSEAINRYLARIVKLAGDNEWESAQIDAMIDTLEDLSSKIRPMRYEQDEDKKKILLEKILSEILPFYLSRFETIARNNNGHLAAGKLTWVDFNFTCRLTEFNKAYNANILENYPILQALVNKVESIPAIKEWIDTRPNTR